MKNLSKTKVSKIVARNYKTARVFSAKGIDFCCNGGISLEEACENRQVDLKAIIEEIEKILVNPETENFEEMPADELVQYIVRKHHAYVRNTVPTLISYLKKVATVHGDRHPELLEIQGLFEQSALELLSHMSKEERILFPYIQEMTIALNRGDTLSKPLFGHVANPIKMMEKEHEQEGNRFKKIAGLSDNYTPPNDACQTYRVLFSMLQEFETDLHRHIHLENNILFPKILSDFDLNLA